MNISSDGDPPSRVRYACGVQSRIERFEAWHRRLGWRNPWRFVLVALLFAGAGLGTPAAPLVVLLQSAVCLDLYLLLLRRRRARLATSPLNPRSARRATAVGFVFGAVYMSALMAVLLVAGWYRLRPAGGIPFVGLALALLVFFGVGFAEEVLFRGLLFPFVERRAGSLLALTSSALVFGLGHVFNPNATLLAGVAIAVEAGILFAAVYMLTQNLWVPIGLHWSWNLFEGPVYGTPVSGLDEWPSLFAAREVGPDLWTGGRFGPEAGLACMLLGTALGLLLLWAAYRRGRWVRFREAWRSGRSASASSGDERDEHLRGGDAPVSG